jgi:hypothetical protein
MAGFITDEDDVVAGLSLDDGFLSVFEFSFVTLFGELFLVLVFMVGLGRVDVGAVLTVGLLKGGCGLKKSFEKIVLK